MRVLDLFSGIGGFSLGLEMAGDFETVAFVEYDEKCQAVLRKHWPDVPIMKDVREVEGDEFGPVDVVCGGFPCQPFSHAGRQLGQEDDRHLWPEMLRIIQRARPAWVIGENVAGLIPMGLDQVLSDLEASGYTARAYVIPACAVDAPHRRDRVWILGHTDSQGESAGAHDEASGLCGVGHADASGAVAQGADVADADRERGCSRDASREHAADVGQSSRRSGAHPQRLEKWISEPAVGRVVDGIPGRVDRLKQLGNAVVPQVVAELGRAILGSRKASGGMTMEQWIATGGTKD